MKEIDKYLKELEQKEGLTEEEKQEKKLHTKKFQKYETFFKEPKENLSRLE